MNEAAMNGGAMNEAVLLGDLRQMWAAADPVPDDLVERVLFTLQLEDLEVELMRLHEVVEPVGARGEEPSAAGAGTAGAETAGTITFSSESLTVMLTISPDGARRRRVDGWIAPAAALRIELRCGDGAQHAAADAEGRFSFDAVPAGLIQLRVEPTDGAAVTLARPVVTPAVQI